MIETMASEILNTPFLATFGNLQLFPFKKYIYRENVSFQKKKETKHKFDFQYFMQIFRQEIW